MKNFFMTALILLSIRPQAWAESLTLATQNGKIFVPQMKGWELGKDMFGMPFVYFSPQKNGQRSNMSFTATGVDVTFDLAASGKDADGYKKLKETWAQKVSATPQSYLPYRQWKNAYNHAVHEVGFTYLHQKKNYFEKSYYIECRGRLIFAKSLRLDVNKEHEKDFSELIKGLDCSL